MNYLALVQKYRAQFDSLSGDERAWSITNAVALALASEGAGLLSKPSGHNYKGYSVDIVMYKDGKLRDCLGDSEGAANPQWNDAGTADPGLWRPAIGTPTTPPPTTPPPTPPPPTDDTAARLKAIDENVAAIRVVLEKAASRFGL